MQWRRFNLEAVIERLRLRGIGGEETGIRAVAGFTREPCPRCGGKRFESRPYFPGLPLGPDRLPPVPEVSKPNSVIVYGLTVPPCPHRFPILFK